MTLEDNVDLLQGTHHEIAELIRTLNKLNDPNLANTVRSRPLSVAITELETGVLWLNRAVLEAAQRLD